MDKKNTENDMKIADVSVEQGGGGIHIQLGAKGEEK